MLNFLFEFVEQYAFISHLIRFILLDKTIHSKVHTYGKEATQFYYFAKKNSDIDHEISNMYST
jgi:hypothetical protein